MTRERFDELFDSEDDPMSDEYIQFERVQNKLSQNRDLHAFLLMESIEPVQYRLIAGADHDVVYLEGPTDSFIEKLTEEQAIDLIRCGIHYENDGFAIYC
jgi:hypothetical protein